VVTNVALVLSDDHYCVLSFRRTAGARSDAFQYLQPPDLKIELPDLCIKTTAMPLIAMSITSYPARADAHLVAKNNNDDLSIAA